jgi:uncharacterized glyoxalase superfamily protein PhnB
MMKLDHLRIPVTDPTLSRAWYAAEEDEADPDDAAATAAALERNGVRFVNDLHQTSWGTREFAIKDDQGHTLYFGART